MKYRRPSSPVFWVPMPYTGAINRMDLINWKYFPAKQPEQITLTDPETGDYTVEVLEIDGPFEIDQVPDKFGRQIINKDTTGLILGKLLKTRMPEFSGTNKVLFYLVNPINQTT
jgi:hypothetical protein